VVTGFDEIVWLKDETARMTACPVCGSAEGKAPVLRTRSLGDTGRMLTLLGCPDCHSRFWDDLTPLAYEEPAAYGWATEFYVEQGAGLEALIEPIARLASSRIGKMLEIGCGYGFSLDAGCRLFGWQPLGVDPSPLAAAGTRDLGVPIRPIYAAADTDLGGPFDLVYGSEVIEHVAESNEFLKICRAQLADDGILALTTPDAACIQPDTPMPTLLPALSPGHHLVLFSAEGLRLALERAGFTSISVRADGPRLIAYGACRPLDFDPLAPLDRRLYRNYLEAVLARNDLPLSLEVGMRSRLLKELTFTGAYPEASEELARLAALFEARLNFSPVPSQAPQLAASIERTGMAERTGIPWSLPGIYYCRGMIAMNHAGRHEEAAASFDAAARLARACRVAHAAVGIGDGETAMLETAAEECAILALSVADPPAAVERLRKFGTAQSGIWRTMVVRFIDLGHLELAKQVARDLGDPAAEALVKGFDVLLAGDAAGAQPQFDRVLAESDDFTEPATRGLMLALTSLDPNEVADRAEKGGFSAWLNETLFCRLVDLGHAAAAIRLEPLLGDREKWQVLSRVGLIRLVLDQAGEAVTPLAESFVRARREGSGATLAECCQIKNREVLARLLTQDALGAAHAAAEILDPSESWVPDEARAEMEQLLAPHEGVRALLDTKRRALKGAGKSSAP